LKLLPWIWSQIGKLDFSTTLDAFGGTGSVSYMLKAQGKQVVYNDYLRSNHLIGIALVQNSTVRLSQDDIDFVTARHPQFDYDDFIARTFDDIYFTPEENAWLDVVAQNIPRLRGRYKRAIAYYGLFQSCISKRPYNLFHRKNLYIRTANVKRSFGNKATWDKGFEEHFRYFVSQANDAIFESETRCKALCRDALEIPGLFDLVYIDTPYISRSGVGVDYFHFYHFLEGLTEYRKWQDRIDYSKKHRPLKGERSPWSDPKRCQDAFARLFEQHRKSIIVVSYRSDGIPSEQELAELLGSVKTGVRRLHYGQYKYVLSTNGRSKETLLIGI